MGEALVQVHFFTLFFFNASSRKERQHSKLSAPCSSYQYCGQCLRQPDCNWCNDPKSEFGGVCLEGTPHGPKQGKCPGNWTMNLDHCASGRPFVCLLACFLPEKI